jgi:hypothetical protein
MRLFYAFIFHLLTYQGSDSRGDCEEASRMIVAIANEMNETKRRGEMVAKYKNDGNN